MEPATQQQLIQECMQSLRRIVKALEDYSLGVERRFGLTGPQLWALWELGHGLNQTSKAMLGRHGVTGPQRLVLRVAQRSEPVGLAELARVLRLHPASVTRLARSLERRKFLRRVRHPTDRRRLMVELGPAGRQVVRRRAGTVESAVRAALDAASPADVEATLRVLRELAGRLAR